MYYDSRQLRSFDIAGPELSVLDLQYIEKQYSIYREEKRKAALAQLGIEKRLQELKTELERDDGRKLNLNWKSGTRVAIEHVESFHWLRVRRLVLDVADNGSQARIAQTTRSSSRSRQRADSRADMTGSSPQGAGGRPKSLPNSANAVRPIGRPNCFV